MVVDVLKSGETLNFLAQRYGVRPNDLRAANPNLDFSKIKGGESRERSDQAHACRARAGDAAVLRGVLMFRQ